MAPKHIDDDVYTPESDQVIVLHDISWKQYSAVLDMLGDTHPGIRTHYLEGVLEIMSPSEKHEGIKTMLARLVEIYAVERTIELNGFGQATYRRRVKERGLEPDECYFIGRKRRFPDIAFEVVLSHGIIDRLAIYQGLGVREVWLWRRGAFEIHRLTKAGYKRRDRSRFLPELDFTVLATLVQAKDQTQAIREFRDSLRARS